MTNGFAPQSATLSRAQGCLLGQLAGDALGSLVEFRSPADIRFQYPDGVRDLADGGTWDTIAGQPTDDSEMALALAESLLHRCPLDPVDLAQRCTGLMTHAVGMTLARAIR